MVIPLESVSTELVLSKIKIDQDAGFTLSAGISDATTTAGHSCRLQYEYGTNKLV